MNRDVCRYQIVTTGPDYGRLDFHHMVEVWPAIMWHGGVTKKVIKMIIVNNYNTMDNVSLGLKSKLRGYYIRWKAIDQVQRVFVQQASNLCSQIISLGAGFDTTFFRLQSEGLLSKCRVFEVDFTSVIKRKLDAVAEIPHLQQCIGEWNCVNSEFIASEHYCAICCDINNLSALHHILDKAGVDFNAPTLFLSECVLTYINPNSVNALLAWSAVSFANAVFCSYEQILPHDTFGQIMQRHFKLLQSPLKNICLYPTQLSQERRYLAAGWKVCQSCDMTTFFDFLPAEEKQRIDNLELFDEYEEWQLKCSHYSILCAFNGLCTSLASQLLPCSTQGRLVLQCVYGNCRLEVSSKHSGLKRYGHGSCLLPDGNIIVVGGYGESLRVGSAPHSRLNDTIKLHLDMNNEWELCDLDMQGIYPGRLMHHTVTAIAGGTCALVIGGRGSPAQPNELMFLLQLKYIPHGKAVWSKLELHPESSLMEPRWRHTATCIQLCDGEECVLIVGGSCTSSRALADIYMLNITTWRLTKLCLSLPQGRCSHSSAVWHRGLLIAGGIDSSLKPISSCLYLMHTECDGWSLSSLQLSPPLPPKYSMGIVVCGEHLILLGGVGLQSSPDIIIVNLTLRIWFGLMVPCTSMDILLHKHTCHMLADGKILVVGGGGNCFSFGTHLNTGLYVIDALPLCV